MLMSTKDVTVLRTPYQIHSCSRKNATNIVIKLLLYIWACAKNFLLEPFVNLYSDLWSYILNKLYI